MAKIADKVDGDILSATKAQSRVENLLSDGDKSAKAGDTKQAFSYYSRAYEVIKTNPDAFAGEKRLKYFDQIKAYYNSNGYAFEGKEVLGDRIALAKQLYPGNSLKTAIYYHDIGYTYERYRYYKLMLRALLRSEEILSRCEHDANFFNSAAYIYISLGYAYLKNGQNSDAEKWYRKAKELLESKGDDLQKASAAFIYNGLFRYYNNLEKNIDKTIETLDTALNLRRELLNNQNVSSKRSIATHIVNTYSNKIQLYLQHNLIQDAEKEYKDFLKEQDILKDPKDFHDSWRRIYTDYGDILIGLGKYGRCAF